MDNASFHDTWVLADNGNYEEAIKMITKLIDQHKDETSNEKIILNYKSRAEWHYFSKNYGDVESDIKSAMDYGFCIEKSEKFFFMYQHSKLQAGLNTVIASFEKQVALKYRYASHNFSTVDLVEWECDRIVMLLRSIKLTNIFIGKRIRERSQSADRGGKRK
ncbi:unnamed protein product [Rotaria socialis]